MRPGREGPSALHGSHRRSFDDVAGPGNAIVPTVSTEGTRMRHGLTLVEVAVALALVALAAAIAVPRVTAQLHGMAVAAAAAETAGALQAARDQAITEGRPVTAYLDEASAAVTVVSDTDTLLRRDLAAAHAVGLSASRDSIAYLPDALAVGAANLGIVLSRGSRTRTITVSRLGRVRW